LWGRKEGSGLGGREVERAVWCVMRKRWERDWWGGVRRGRGWKRGMYIDLWGEWSECDVSAEPVRSRRNHLRAVVLAACGFGGVATRAIKSNIHHIHVLLCRRRPARSQRSILSTPCRTLRGRLSPPPIPQISYLRPRTPTQPASDQAPTTPAPSSRHLYPRAIRAVRDRPM
jgi:alpha/beta superfamily hydrolase